MEASQELLMEAASQELMEASQTTDGVPAPSDPSLKAESPVKDVKSFNTHLSPDTQLSRDSKIFVTPKWDSSINISDPRMSKEMEVGESVAGPSTLHLTDNIQAVMNKSTEVEIIDDPGSEGEVAKEPDLSKLYNVKIVANHHE